MTRGSLIFLAGCAAAALVMSESPAHAGGPMAVHKSDRPYRLTVVHAPAPDLKLKGSYATPDRSIRAFGE